MKETYEPLEYYIKMNNGESTSVASDSITTSKIEDSTEHDNGFIDWGELE